MISPYRLHQNVFAARRLQPDSLRLKLRLQHLQHCGELSYNRASCKSGVLWGRDGVRDTESLSTMRFNESAFEGVGHDTAKLKLHEMLALSTHVTKSSGFCGRISTTRSLYWNLALTRCSSQSKTVEYQLHLIPQADTGRDTDW